jgi:hypothetical protein
MLLSGNIQAMLTAPAAGLRYSRPFGLLVPDDTASQPKNYAALGETPALPGL